MSMSAMAPSWPAGDVRRPPLGRAVRAALLVGIVFELFAYVAKEIPALYTHSPWQDDPYDGAVSFALFFVPVLLVLITGSAFHCRRQAPLDSGRAHGLWRASAALLTICGATLGVEWISVLMRTHAADWNATTVGVTIALAGVSALTVAAGVALTQARWHRASRASYPGNDWIDDTVDAAASLSAHFGSPGRALSGLLRRAHAASAPSWRRHPVVAAMAIAVLFGLLLATVDAVAEGGRIASTTGLLFFSVAAGGFFAFVMVLGRFLWLRTDAEPAIGMRRRLLDAATVGAAFIPLSLLFRPVPASLQALVPAGRWAIVVFVLAAGLAGFMATFAVESMLRTHSGRTEPPA